MSLHALPLPLTDRVPAELIEQILREAQWNIQTLLACLRVCTAWHSFLISSLYESIHLCGNTQLDKLAHAAWMYPAVRARLASVRAITLMPDGHNSPPPPSEIDAQVFSLMLGPHLHSVEELSFLNCLRRPLHSSFFAMLPQLAKVKRLSLASFQLGSFFDFQRMVCAFPLLEELHLMTSMMCVGRARRAAPLPEDHLSVLRPPKLALLCMEHSSLQVDDGFLVNVVRWLTTGGNLRALDIRGSLRTDESIIISLLRRAASTLECLRMTGLDWDDWGRTARFYSHGFEYLAHLRTLDISFKYWCWGFTQKLRGVLSCIATPTLEALRLQIDNTLQEDATADYDALHAVLTRTVFDRLARVTVVMTSQAGLIYRKDGALNRNIYNEGAKNLAAGVLMHLRILFAPWLARGVVRALVGGAQGPRCLWYTGVVAKAGEEPLWLYGKAGIHARSRLLADWRI